MKKNSLTHADVTAACFCMLVFFFSAAPMRAQSTFGDIIGVVKDPGQELSSAPKWCLPIQTTAPNT